MSDRVPLADLSQEQGDAVAEAMRILLGAPTEDKRLAYDIWLAHQWFVIRNVPGDYGERLVCRDTTFRGLLLRRGCGQIHDCITWCCVTRPFLGKKATLMYLSSITNDERPATLARHLPLLMTEHPLTAAALARRDEAEALLGWVIGRVEPISASEAARHTFRVQMKHAAFDPTL